jgi:hypothetical protein
MQRKIELQRALAQLLLEHARLSGPDSNKPDRQTKPTWFPSLARLLKKNEARCRSRLR